MTGFMKPRGFPDNPGTKMTTFEFDTSAHTWWLFVHDPAPAIILDLSMLNLSRWHHALKRSGKEKKKEYFYLKGRRYGHDVTTRPCISLPMSFAKLSHYTPQTHAFDANMYRKDMCQLVKIYRYLACRRHHQSSRRYSTKPLTSWRHFLHKIHS